MRSEDLIGSEAKQKLKELAEGIDFAMLATNLSEHPLHIVPMSTKRVDNESCVWFLSGKDSQHNENIESSSHVQLVYGDCGAMRFLSVYGEASITTDRSVLEDLYGSSDDAWFNGIDDPNLTAIKVMPTDAHYWDPKSNKLVTLLKMGMGAITGEQPDLMDQGSLQV